MTPAKRHHTVPQFYLRGFADGDQIATVKLPGNVSFVQAVRKAASETHFHRVDGHPDGPDVFEKLLSQIEGEASGVFELIESGSWPLDVEKRMTLAHFIALQAVRGPEHRRTIGYLSAQLARLEIGYGGRGAVADWAARRAGVELTDEQAGRLWDLATGPDGPPAMEVAPIVHIQQMAEMTDHLMPYLAGRPWTLYRFDRRALLTSDCPVGLLPRPDQSPGLGTGFVSAWAITYPLTRRLGLIMSDPMPFADFVSVERVWEGALDHAEVGTTMIEKTLNASTCSSASQWLYHHPSDSQFLPRDLPEPRPVKIKMVGGPGGFPPEPPSASSVED